MLAFSNAADGAGRRIPRSRTRLSGSPPQWEITAKSSPIPGEPLPPSMQPKVSRISRPADSTALTGKSAYPVRQMCRARGQAASSVMIFSHRRRGFRYYLLAMASQHLTHFVVVGAGAAGLMTARELARAGKRVTILEAKTRCGGRIYPLSVDEFGYPAEGGAEFVHGAAPVTRALMREAGLALSPRGGTRWSTRSGALSTDESSTTHMGRFYQALAEVKDDLPIAEFLETHFADR